MFCNQFQPPGLKSVTNGVKNGGIFRKDAIIWCWKRSQRALNMVEFGV